MTHNISTAPFRSRRTWLIEVRQIRGWKLKIYGICAEGCELESAVIETALQHAATHVAWPQDGSGYGFAMLHHGEEAVWLLVDLWMNDILRHFLFRAPLAEPEQFMTGPSDGTMACVWEIEVMTHERNSWVKHVLSRPLNPDFEGYLQDALNIDAE